jgi:acetyl esterase/lipase
VSHRIALLAPLLALSLLGLAACSSGREHRAVDPTSRSVAPPGESGGRASGSGCVGPLDGPQTHPYATADGVDPDRLSLDVYRRPQASDCPVIVWVHGGGWRTGDKQGQAIETKAEWAGSLGMALVSVNYRLVGQDDVMWPTFATDVAASVDWVIDHAQELGIDPARLVVMGHSAGAHLVSILGTNPTLLESVGRSPSVIRCVISLDTGSYDMREKMADSRALVEPAFGDDPDTLGDGSPIAQVELHGGPVPDTLIVARGTAGRRQQAEDFAAALRDAGASVTLIDIQGYTHADVNRRLGEDGESKVTPPVTDFLHDCVG